jgi:hypothetical protein
MRAIGLFELSEYIDLVVMYVDPRNEQSLHSAFSGTRQRLVQRDDALCPGHSCYSIVKEVQCANDEGSCF